MLEKRVGEPCPTCSTPLMRRRSTFRTISGDVAYCAHCCAAYELVREEQKSASLAPAPEFALI